MNGWPLTAIVGKCLQSHLQIHLFLVALDGSCLRLGPRGREDVKQCERGELVQHDAHLAHDADAVPERLPSRAAQKRARLRACGRVRVRLYRGRGGAGECGRRVVRARP